MKIDTLFQKKKPVYSFEVFPPKKDAPVEKLYATLEAIAQLQPDYISVTYGAGGTGQSQTAELAALIKNRYGVEPLAHVTGIHSTEEQVTAYLDRLKAEGIENVLALRGDVNPAYPQPGRFPYATELVKFIRGSYDFNLVGAGYPEGHYEAKSRADDIRHLKEKVDAGITHINTQLFFDNEDFYSFLELIRAAGVDVPIQAGIMPITRKSQIERTVTMTGCNVPRALARIFARYADNPAALREAGIAYATQQIVDLISYGVDGIHLYIMNDAATATAITTNIKSLLG